MGGLHWTYMEIAICIPHGDKTYPAFWNSLWLMQNHTHTVMPEVQFSYIQVELHIISKARNKIVEMALGSVDYLLWVDDDIILPHDAFVRLYQRRQAFISGLYFSRRPPPIPQMYGWMEKEKAYMSVYEYPEGLLEVDAVGGGFCLAQVDVYRKLEQLPQGRCLGVDMSPWYEFMDGLGEDFYFCRKLKELGVPVLVDTTVKAEHLATLPIGEKDFKHLWESGQFGVEGDITPPQGRFISA